MTKRSCADCHWCVLWDNGYSNYTVEGTDAYCLKELNPEFPVDAFYGREPAMYYAENCTAFKEGEPFYCDVDQEEIHLKDKDSALYNEPEGERRILLLEFFKDEWGL